MKATIVFQKNWQAANLMCYFVKKIDEKKSYQFYSVNTSGEMIPAFIKPVDESKYRLDVYENVSYLVDINGTEEFGKEVLYRRYKYILNKGSSRSSKTVSLIDVCDLYSRSNKNKRVTVWRDTKVDCKSTVLSDMELHLKNTDRWGVDFSFNKTESFLSYTTGTKIEILGVDDENKVMGKTQDVAWLNEPYKISKEIFNQIDQRTYDFILIDLNPKMNHWSDDLQKDNRCIVINSTFRDNPFCPEEARRKRLSYQPVSRCYIVTEKIMHESDAKKYDTKKNKLNISSKHISELIRCMENENKNSASEFNYDVYALGLKSEKPNRIFSWQEISPTQWEELDVKIYTGCDWGSVDPWGIVDAKYYDGALYLKERNYLSENEWRSRMTPTELAQVAGSDEGLVTWMFKRLGVPFDRDVICDNNRNTKIRALRESGWDYAIPAYKKPGSILDGVDVLQNLRVYFTSDSLNLKYEQENYSRKVVQGIILEEPEEGNDHLIDPTRYIALYLQMIGVITKI